MDNTYVVASKYELFIRRVFNCDENKHGAHLSNMQNVMFMDQGKSYSKHLGSLQKQFVKVQGYIEKAIQYLLKNSKKEEDKEFFKNLLIELQNSTSTEQLMKVIDLALNKLTDNINRKVTQI